jgi:hypothetical protein
MKVDAFGFCSVSLEFFDIQGSLNTPQLDGGPHYKRERHFKAYRDLYPCLTLSNCEFRYIMFPIYRDSYITNEKSSKTLPKERLPSTS